MDTATVDLARIAEDIWAAILGQQLRPYPGEPSFGADERVVTGIVQITGDFEGAVSVQLPEDAARASAAQMFAMEPDEISEEEVSDTVGELANMTGGNVKSTLGGSCQLSLPSVTTGRDYYVSVPGTQVHERIGLVGDGSVVILTMLERSGS